MKISVSKLSKLYEAFSTDDSNDVWGTKDTVLSVIECLTNNNLEQKSFQLHNSEYEYNHSARIAFLVNNKDLNPIDLDIGIPSVGYYPDNVVLDGNHRLAAAIIRKDKTIEVEYAGCVSYFTHLFIKTNKKFL